MWMMILIGVALAAGFVFALRSQINTYRIAQAEEQLKVKLDEYTSHQKFLARDQQRALSAGEVERAGMRNGLDYLKLEREEDQSKASARRVVSPIPSPRVGQGDRQVNKAPLSIRPGRPALQVKVVGGVKTGKAAKVVKIVKVNAVKRESAANKARANVVKTRKQNQRQTPSARR
jgi:hypothetical protein